MKTAKWVAVSYVMSLAAGGLCHKFFNGNMRDEDKAAMVILTLTVMIIIGIFCTVGIRRWRAGNLSRFEKGLLVFSLVMFPGMFVIGWRSDIF